MYVNKFQLTCQLENVGKFRKKFFGINISKIGGEERIEKSLKRQNDIQETNFTGSVIFKHNGKPSSIYLWMKQV